MLRLIKVHIEYYKVWTVECTFTIGDNVHYMAKLQSKGQFGMQENFKFSFSRPKTLDFISNAAHYKLKYSEIF